tara:strand:- start:7591 stop:7929 length:339 start_codon:yes stop_codon:yes gene_type:complete
MHGFHRCLAFIAAWLSSLPGFHRYLAFINRRRRGASEFGALFSSRGGLLGPSLSSRKGLVYLPGPAFPANFLTGLHDSSRRYPSNWSSRLFQSSSCLLNQSVARANARRFSR